MNPDTKRILFITGTRADFGKLKPLIRAVEDDEKYEAHLFVTGMHALSRYGLTADEVHKEGFKRIHLFMNQIHGEPMDQILANTVSGLSRYVREIQPNLIVIHGDRVEALAAAIVGSFNNILVAHVEGGEVSGTIDELIRHSTSKLAHIHFVANDEASNRLIQMGEQPQRVHIIGSPDIDIMLSDDLPSIDDVRSRYGLDFKNYGIVLFHPVTTEISTISEQANALAEAILDSDLNYVVIYPNNDEGSSAIFEAYKKFEKHNKIKTFPSLRFEYFISLLKESLFILGNSSAGVREAPVFGVPTINLGTRQQNRFHHDSIFNVQADRKSILKAIENVKSRKRFPKNTKFGSGDSKSRFMKILNDGLIWQTPHQKQFNDVKI